MPRTLLFPVLLTGCYDSTSPSATTGPTGTWTAPENTWDATEGPPDTLVGQGFLPGQVVPDVRLPDQFEQEVSLWQFYGNVIVLDVSTIWCGPCQTLGEQTQETQADYGDQGFTYVTVLQEDNYSNPPDTDDLMLWVTGYSLDSPVLADGEKIGTGDALDPIPSYPVVLVIDRKMKVAQRVDPPTDAELRAAIEATL